MILIPFTLFIYSTESAFRCGNDLIVDDFKIAQTAIIGGQSKNLNLMGGDYGSAGADFSIDVINQQMIITSGTAPIGVPEPQANPGTLPTLNYWFTKFNENSCFDLTPYRGIQFDLVAPPGSDMNFTLSQKSPDCVPSTPGQQSSGVEGTRLVDSSYHALTQYIIPNGQKQKVTLLLSDFSKNLVGGSFDFKHLKDWTIVNLEPVGAVFLMSNITLLGGPVGCTPNLPPNYAAPQMNKTSASASPSNDANSTRYFSKFILTILLIIRLL